MVKKLSAAIENELGFKLSSSPKLDYQQSAQVVWWVMRNAVPDDAQPVYRDRKGFNVTGMSPISVIKDVWNLHDDSDKAAASAAYARVKKLLDAQDAVRTEVAGKGRVPGVYWVADTWELPTDWTPEDETAERGAEGEHNGKEVPMLILTEQGVPGESLADQLDKGWQLIRDAFKVMEQRNAVLAKDNETLRTTNESLVRKVDAARATLLN